MTQPPFPQAPFAQAPFAQTPPQWAHHMWRPLPPHPRSTVSLVLGILSVVGLAVVGPLAWYYGATAMRDIDREPARWQGRGQAQAGLVMGIIGTIMLVLGTALLLLIVAGIAVLNNYDSGYPT